MVALTLLLKPPRPAVVGTIGRCPRSEGNGGTLAAHRTVSRGRVMPLMVGGCAGIANRLPSAGRVGPFSRRHSALRISAGSSPWRSLPIVVLTTSNACVVLSGHRRSSKTSGGCSQAAIREHERSAPLAVRSCPSALRDRVVAPRRPPYRVREESSSSCSSLDGCRSMARVLVLGLGGLELDAATRRREKVTSRILREGWKPRKPSRAFYAIERRVPSHGLVSTW